MWRSFCRLQRQKTSGGSPGPWRWWVESHWSSSSHSVKGWIHNDHHMKRKWRCKANVLRVYRHASSSVFPTLIHGIRVEYVQTCKYLGTVFGDRLIFSENREIIVKKAQRCLYSLHKPLWSRSVHTVLLLLLVLKKYIYISWLTLLVKKDNNQSQGVIVILSKQLIFKVQLNTENIKKQIRLNKLFFFFFFKKDVYLSWCRHD